MLSAGGCATKSLISLITRSTTKRGGMMPIDSRKRRPSRT